MRALLFLVASALPLALASNATEEDEGLSGGAIAGIIIACLAGAGAIGAAVYYFYLRPGASMGSMGSSGDTPASTARHLGENNLPMVALRVKNDDEL